MIARPLSVHHVLESNRQLAELLQRAREIRRSTEQVRRQLPPDLAGHVTAAQFEEGRLVLLTDSPVWASRLRFAEPGLRASLNHVGEIKVKVLPSGGMIRTRKRSRPGVRTLSAQSAEQIRAIAAAVSDPQLTRALLKLAAHGDENNQYD